MRINYVREQIEAGTVQLVFVGTDFNVADILTKSLDADLHTRHSNVLLHGFEGVIPRQDMINTPEEIRRRDFAKMRAAKKRSDNARKAKPPTATALSTFDRHLETISHSALYTHEDLEERAPVFAFYKNNNRVSGGDLHVSSCIKCLRRLTIHHYCDSCLETYLHLKISRSYQRNHRTNKLIRMTGLFATDGTPVHPQRISNTVIWNIGDRVGFLNRRAEYGGVQISARKEIEDYTENCGGPYVMHLQNQRKIIDAALHRGPLSMANHRNPVFNKYGSRLADGDRANFEFEEEDECIITGIITQTIYNGDEMYVTYSTDHNFDMTDANGNVYTFRTY
jgi:hypothetical protein